jgi:PucR family transcriptional regulator, purine catabolism regulatory protein
VTEKVSHSAANEPSITLRAALRLPALRRAVPEVIAGADGLDRPVRWVHAGEVPDMPSLLMGGELLLTTGMGIGKGEADQRRFAAALAERGVAALALELGSTFADVPPALRAEAQERGLPLIVLHRESAFVEITEDVHREIVSHQHVLMRRGDELHARFTRLMLDGAGIPEVLAALAEAIANPVVLDKAGHGLLYHATHHADDREVLAAWEGVRRGLPGTPDHVEAPVPMGSGETWGRLVVLAVDSPLDEFDRVAAERAVGLIALALLRGREEDVLAARERGNLLAELLDGSIEEAEAARRAASLGFDGQPRALLPVVVAHAGGADGSRTAADGGRVIVDGRHATANGRFSAGADRRRASADGRRPNGDGRSVGADRNGAGEAAWAIVLRDVTSELSGAGMAAIGGLRGPEAQVMLVLGLSAPERRAEAAGRVTADVRASAARQLGDGTALAVCVGAAAPTWGSLRESLVETLATAPAALAAPPRDWHDVTAPDLHRLFWSLREHDELQRFAQRRLGPLIEHDRRRKAKLLPTLEAYLAHGGRKAETARALHLERQSLYHRLGRIQELLGEDLDDEDVRLGLHVALRTLRYADD